MKKTKKIISIGLIIIILISNSINIFAKTIESSEKINLKYDHDCISVLQIKGKDVLKQVAYVCYQDPDTKIKYPAFCVEPTKIGIGTGAGYSYDVTISKLNNPALWRILYKGYVGTDYKDWGLNYDDDLYFATKTAVHCLVDGVSPKEKYEIPKRVGYGDNVTLEEVQTRGAKVLEIAQEIYEYGINSSDNYIKAIVKIIKDTESEITLNNKKYLVQNYKVTSNKELSSYDVKISNFPSGTIIINSKNIESKTMNNNLFKIAIPKENIKENIKGIINIYNAKVKSYPIFYASSGNSETQDYVISDREEVTQAETILTIDAYKSTLKIIKNDDENKPVQNAVFSIKYKDGENLGDYVTDKNGIITINKLKQGDIVVTEKKVDERYILDSSSKNVKLEFNKDSTLTINNKLKRGNLKIIKVDKDNTKIKIPNVEFELFDNNKKCIGKYITDEKGEIFIKNLKIGNYYLKETKENDLYYPLKEEIKIEIEYKKDTTMKIENEKLKGNIEILKIDKDFNEIKIKDAEFEIINSKGEVVQKVKTDENGYAKTLELPVGEYKICEVSTNENYILDKKNISVKIEKDKTLKVVIENTHKKGNLHLLKVDKDDNEIAVEGVVFDLYSEEFNKIVGTYITDEKGEIYINNLRTGKYSLIEKETNEWYNLNEKITEVEVECDLTADIFIENEAKKGQAKIIKVDKENNEIKLKGVEFEVLDEDNSILETIITDEKGEAITKEYPLIDFKRLKIREKCTTQDYVLSEEIKIIELEDKVIKDVIFENEKIKIPKIEITPEPELPKLPRTGF